MIVTVRRVDHGVVAFGWGLALNGAVTLPVPARRPCCMAAGGRPDSGRSPSAVSCSRGRRLPLALQVLYVIALRFASSLGTGRGTTFSYAYLIAAFLVAITATSIALVATVPFARAGATPERVARHVVATSWISLVLVAAAAGFFALAGEAVVRRVLGESYGGGSGRAAGSPRRLSRPVDGRVGRRHRRAIRCCSSRASGGGCLGSRSPSSRSTCSWNGCCTRPVRAAGRRSGARRRERLVWSRCSTSLGALTERGPAWRSPPRRCAAGSPRRPTRSAAFVLGPLTAAFVGLALYLAVLAVWRPVGLRQAWAYVRALQ